uniref:CBS domain-containing protein n=1 Tax=Candidatus Kentrum sp. MB TaxID=2138164 RepID=A0A450XF56_9GAMM|nr:MAG: CBS domain-containing protein [Candidatus Kentron sp. MB]VFK74467.1 MAG: CBS domain-containing protein [Candidatus Kentron sp. MB]
MTPNTTANASSYSTSSYESPTYDQLVRYDFFRQLEQEAREEITAFARHLSLPADRIVFRHGSPYQGVIHVILSGIVRQVWPDGKAVERCPGDLLGIAGYLDNRRYASTITTRTDCAFWLLPINQLRQLETRYSSVSDAMDRMIAERIHCCVEMTMDATAPLSGLSVSHAMKAPLVCCEPDTPLREAFALMRKKGISSLAVMEDEKTLSGLLTYPDLYDAIFEKGISREGSISSAGYRTPHEIAENASLRQAEHLQQRKSVKHLIVTRQGKPAGILSQTDILRAIVSASPSLLAEIRRAKDFAALRQFHDKLPQFTADVRNGNRSITATIRALGEAHQGILQRCVTLTLREFGKSQGTPPGPFALLILGSGGRDEMLLTPDQDNAMILGDSVTEDTARKWFADFTNLLNQRMADVGYALCPGEIMARNPAWRKELSDWKRQLDHIIRYPTPKAARWSHIVLDFKFLYGDETLLSGLRQQITEKLRENPRLLRMMVEDDAEGRPPLGFFDRLITTTANGQKNRIDLKRNALRIVADAARVYAWREGIPANNTVDRFQALSQKRVLSREFVKTTLAAYDALLDLYLEQRLQRALRGDTEDTLLDYNLLTPHEQELLRISLRAVKRLQERLQGDFEVGLW